VQPILIDRIKNGSGITAIDPLKQYFIRDNNTLHFIIGKKKVVLKVKKPQRSQSPPAGVSQRTQRPEYQSSASVLCAYLALFAVKKDFLFIPFY
jgi:hypothetical protein